MGSIALQRADVIVGVDTHKAEHVGFAIDGLGGDLGELQVLAIPSGYAELLAWADNFEPVHAFGVEGTGSYGSGLAKLLSRHGRKVIECSRPPRAGERRGNGKSDAIDAEHADRQVLAWQGHHHTEAGRRSHRSLAVVEDRPGQRRQGPLPVDHHPQGGPRHRRRRSTSRS